VTQEPEQPRDDAHRAPAAPSDGRRRIYLGCAKWGAIGLAAFVALWLAIGFAFDQGKDAAQPSQGVNAGTAEEYARGSVTELLAEPVYITRLADGEFIALYDKSARQQTRGSGCRVLFNEQAVLPGLPQLEGIEGAFVEECEGTRTTWRADGELAAGAGFGDLDEFETHINDEGDLIIETDRRSCLKARGVPGIPPYDRTTCRGRPD
jgi:hypothetical protein